MRYIGIANYYNGDLQMTLILNYILLFCGTISLVAGIFYFMYEHNHTFLNVLFYLLGIFCFLWCAGYAMVGFSSTYHWEGTSPSHQEDCNKPP